MPKKPDLPTERTSVIRLYVGEWDELRVFHPKLTPTEVIRLLVHNHLKACREAAARNSEIDHDAASRAAGTLQLPLDD